MEWLCGQRLTKNVSFVSSARDFYEEPWDLEHIKLVFTWTSTIPKDLVVVTAQPNINLVNLEQQNLEHKLN